MLLIRGYRERECTIQSNAQNLKTVWNPNTAFSQRYCRRPCSTLQTSWCAKVCNSRLVGIKQQSIVPTITVYCVVLEIKRYIGQKANFSYPLSFNLHDHLAPLRLFFKFLLQTVRVPGLLDGATRGQSNLTKSASRGGHSPVRGHPRGSKFVPLNSWGRGSY